MVRAFRAFDSIRPIGPVATVSFVMTVDPILPITMPRPILAIRPIAFGITPISPIATISPITASGSAPVLSEQLVAAFTTAHLFTQLLQARAAFFEIRAAPLHFPAKVQ